MGTQEQQIENELKTKGTAYARPNFELGSIQGDRLVLSESSIPAFAGNSTALKFRLTAMMKAAQETLKSESAYNLSAEPEAKRQRIEGP